MSKLDIAKAWLAEKYAALHGSSRSEWPMDSYHRDLGFLIDFVTDRWPADMGAEINQLKHELLRIGDRAVVDWDDATVGEVEKIVKPTQTYVEMRRAELKQLDAMRDFIGDEMARSDYQTVGAMRVEIDRLKAVLLAEAERVTEAMLMLERHHRCLAIYGPVVLQVVRMECPVCTWISAERAKERER